MYDLFNVLKAIFSNALIKAALSLASRVIFLGI